MTTFEPKFGQFAKSLHPNQFNSATNQNANFQQHQESYTDQEHQQHQYHNRHPQDNAQNHQFYLHRNEKPQAIKQQIKMDTQSEREPSCRHWRILISIALLLPALAGLIGIVAWAISVEVADTHLHPAGAHTGNSRLKQQHQHQMVAYQILRRHEADQQEQKYQQALKQQQQQQQQRNLAAAAGSGAAFPASSNPSGTSGGGGSSTTTNRPPPVAAPFHSNSPLKPEINAGAELAANPVQVSLSGGKQKLQQQQQINMPSEEQQQQSQQHQSQLQSQLHQQSNNSASEAAAAAAAAATKKDKKPAAPFMTNVQPTTASVDTDDVTISESSSTSTTTSTSTSTRAPSPAEEPQARQQSAQLLSLSSRRLNYIEPSQDNGNADHDASSSSPSAASSSPVELESEGEAEPEPEPETETESESETSHKHQLQMQLQKSKAKKQKQRPQFKNANNIKIASLIDNGNGNNNKQRINNANGNTNGIFNKKSQNGRDNLKPLRQQFRQILGEEVAPPPTTGDGDEEPPAEHQSDQVELESAAPSSPPPPPTPSPAPAPSPKPVIELIQKNRQRELEEEERLNFEAIASAISSTLRDSSPAPAQKQKQQANGNSLDQSPTNPNDNKARHLPRQSASDNHESHLGDTGLLIEPERSSLLAVQQPRPAQTFSSRRKSPGESVGDVIDQLVAGVARRRNLSADSDTANNSRQQQANSIRHGPHIVVVAPISGNELKARSQVKDEAAPAITPAPAIAPAAPAAPVKSDAVAKKTSPAKSSKQPKQATASGAKKQNQSQAPKSNKKQLLGARLLGSSSLIPGQAEQADGIKYSERVVVIQDDDSSGLLARSDAPSISNSDFDSPSIHVASAPSQPRFRSPRHESIQRSLFERYPKQQAPSRVAIPTRARIEEPAVYVSERRLAADDNSADQGQFASVAKTDASTEKHQQHQGKSKQNDQQAKLYSAEQLIREHLMRSKAKQQQHQQQRVPVQIPKVDQEQFNREIRLQPQEAEANQQAQSSPAEPAQQNQFKTYQSEQALPIKSVSTSEQAANVQSQEEQSESSDASIGSQAAESQESGSIVQPAQSPIKSNADNQPSSSNERPQQKQEAHQIHQNHHQQQQHQQSVQGLQTNAGHQDKQHHVSNIVDNKEPAPILPDQEYNVPAHLAESVIQNIQSAPPAMYGYVNGQLALLQNQQQYPNQLQFQHQQYQLNHQHQQQPQQHQQQQVPHQQYLHNQQQQKQLALMRQAASMYRPTYHQAPNQFHANQQQQLYQQAKILPQSFQPNLFQQQQQHQILTNRNGIEQQPASGPAPATAPTSASSPNKAFIHPMAKFALKHLISSIAGQSEAAAAAAAASADSKIVQQATPIAPQRTSRSSEGTASSDPKPMVSSSEPEKVVQARDITQSGLISDPQQQIRFSSSLPDQEVSESNYQQQMPIYHIQEPQQSYQMPPQHPPQHYGPPQANYGGSNYESADDKKTKGITFHFGGGPIGGGTQLITSPMGIFKHLMLPLMPNPRVNLNGKIVFGVVLEKSTAFGAPPKKKHKFWG